MRFRPFRHAIAIAAASVVALGGILAGAEAKSEPAIVHPSTHLTSTKVTGKTLHFVVDVSFKPPAHSSPSSACNGKVEVAEEVKGDQKAPHWAGRLSVLKGLCDAKVKGTLPAALLNHKLAFDIDFDGNSVAAPFSKTSHLKLTSPPPSGAPGGNCCTAIPPAPNSAPSGPSSVTYTAADGHWKGQSTGGGVFINFTVEGGAIRTHFSSTGNMTLKCDTEDGSAKESLLLVGVDFRDEIGLDPSGNFSAHYLHEFEKEFPETTLHEVLPQTAHGNLGSSTGQLTVDVAGASLSATGTNGHTQSGCAGTITFNMFKE